MRIRMFISIPIADEQAVAPVLADMRLTDNVRPSSSSQMHITVRFIGDIDDGRTGKVVKAVSDAVAGMEPFMITIGNAGCFPKPERPSVLWIGAEPGDRLRSLSDSIARNLRASNIKFDERPFKGHITVGRCTGPVNPRPFIEKYSGKELCSFLCDEILIMRSDLGPKGAKHTVLDRIRIGVPN